MEDKKIIESFKKRKKIQIIIPIIGVIFVLLLMSIEQEKFAILIVIGLLIFTWNNWKCPSCKQYFGRGRNPKICPNCGVKLVE